MQPYHRGGALAAKKWNQPVRKPARSATGRVDGCPEAGGGTDNGEPRSWRELPVQISASH
ncbi:hypothetical protein GJ744_008082 [Endocarpon pusillum]|uniref:Uncharacterized protein n=1 Tax=Endocarpon pusillum TaxID=364733 RepID=A0A8H7AL26_9EURO|nr:hypothetical protein GJ744_008082 [Endocarpon pusillum]